MYDGWNKLNNMIQDHDETNNGIKTQNKIYTITTQHTHMMTIDNKVIWKNSDKLCISIIIQPSGKPSTWFPPVGLVELYA